MPTDDPEGGAHSWMKRTATHEEFCTRCDATRPLEEGLP